MRLERLASLAARYYADFVGELERYRRGVGIRYALERLAQLLAQVVLDYAAVRAAREGAGKPGSYRELAAWLAGRLGLGEELRDFLVGLAGFRNVLVHMHVNRGEALELETFEEIRRLMPEVIRALERDARGTPASPTWPAGSRTPRDASGSGVSSSSAPWRGRGAAVTLTWRSSWVGGPGVPSSWGSSRPSWRTLWGLGLT